MFRKSPFFTLAAVGTLAFAGSAQAGPISYQISPNGLAAAESAELAFLSSLQPGSVITEDFENVAGVADNTQHMSITTSVGKFEMVTPGVGGACGNLGYACNAGLAILNGAPNTNPFSGRFNTSPNPGGNKWLDSFDAQDFLFTVATGNNAVGFYITDPNDAGGRFDFVTANGTHTMTLNDVFGAKLGNKGVFFVSFTSDAYIQSIRILTNNSDDGFGVDGVTVGRVPEPGTLALLGLGLLGAGLMRRRS